MAGYAITGTLSPDATDKRKEPTGDHNEQPYWYY